MLRGKSNQLARAAARQVGENPGSSYNPLLFTAVWVWARPTSCRQPAHHFRKQTPCSAVIYAHSDRFVADMVKATATWHDQDFKAFIPSVDALLIDDIQFSLVKSASQEEFFHTFNDLLEGTRTGHNHR